MYHEYIKYQPFSIFAINFNFDNNYGCKLLIYLLIYLIINNLSGLLILFLNYSSEFPVTWTFVQLLWIEGTLDTILTSSPIKKKYNKSWSMNSFAIFWSLLRSIFNVHVTKRSVRQSGFVPLRPYFQKLCQKNDTVLEGTINKDSP